MWRSSSFAKQHVASILDLKAKVFGEKQTDLARWEWEYEQNPQGRSFIRLAVDQSESSKLAGHFATISYQLKKGRESIHACQMLDGFTNADYRRQGLFEGLANDTLQASEGGGVKLAFGFPNTNSYPCFIKKLNFLAPFALFYLIRPLRLSYFTSRVPGLRKLGFFRKIPCLLSRKPSQYDFARCEKVPSDWDVLLQSFEQQVAYHVNRSAAYMEWRYQRCPDRNYEFLQMRQRGGLVGFAVLRLSGNSGHLVDLVCSRKEAWSALLKGACRHLQALGAESAVAYIQPKHCLEKTFRHLCFFRRGAGTPFVLRPLGPEKPSEEIYNAQNWFLMGGDTDFF